MPLRLNVGVSRKLGLPAYSSIGASCHLDLELGDDLLGDPAGLRDRARGAFAAAQEAVDEELARLQARVEPARARDGHAGNIQANCVPDPDGRAATVPSLDHGRVGKVATAGQVRAIMAIARRQHADLDGLLCDLGVTRPEELSLAAASRLIDQLKAAGGA